jgi:hypothetical protein
MGKLMKAFLVLTLAPFMGCGSQGRQHGVVVDYFALEPLAGFTVTDGSSSATTDATGTFSLPAPMGVVLAPVVTGTGYSTLQLASAMAAGDDVDLGPIPIPSSETFGTEQALVKNDQSLALFQVTLLLTGACTSAAGGTLTVTSPDGTSLEYFNQGGLPLATAIEDTKDQRPAAVVFNVPPGVTPQFTLSHPTCTVAPAGTVVVSRGLSLTGDARSLPAEPGDNNTALVLVLE